jgi:hypothetical protein
VVFAVICLVGLLSGRVVQLAVASMANAVAGAVAGWVVGIATTLVLLNLVGWYVGMVMDDKDQEVDWVAVLNRDAHMLSEVLRRCGPSQAHATARSLVRRPSPDRHRQWHRVRLVARDGHGHASAGVRRATPQRWSHNTVHPGALRAACRCGTDDVTRLAADTTTHWLAVRKTRG